MITTTLNKIRACDPCEDGWKKLLKYLDKTKADDEPLPFSVILESNGLNDALWCCRTAPEYNKEWRLFAVWCARQVQHLMTDKRSLDAIDVAERHANGHATDKELSAAAKAAWDAAAKAAWDAAAKAAWTAADDAAWTAAWAARDAAEDAAWAAADDAAWTAAAKAAWDAADDAAWDAAAKAAWTAAEDAAWTAAWAARDAAEDAAWTAAAKAAWDAADDAAWTAAWAARDARDAAWAARANQAIKFKEVVG